MLAPFTPHITEELWHDAMGSETSIHKESWPPYDPEAIKVEQVEVLIQVNGKPKARIMAATERSKEDLGNMALEQAEVKTAIGDKKVMKVIAVPGRLVNIVAK